MGDLTAGAVLAGAIAAALFRRERPVVVRSSTSLCFDGDVGGRPGAIASQLYGVETIPRMHHADLPNPLVAAYATRDGRLLYFAGIQTENHFENFCACIDRKDLLADPRFVTGAERYAHRTELIAVLDEVFASRDLAEWVQRLQGVTTPWTVVQTAREAAIDPQVMANHLIPTVQGAVAYPVVASPAQFDDVPPRLSPAPDHGEHTDEVLMELGRSWEEILELKESDAVF